MICPTSAFSALLLPPRYSSTFFGFAARTPSTIFSRAPVSFNLRLFKRGMEIERFPWSHDIDLHVNTKDLEVENWFV